MANIEKIALFIDGANLYATAKALGFEIDFERLLRGFQDKGRLIRAYYYRATIDDHEHPSARTLIDWLEYNGFSVVTKPAKEFVDATGRRKIKGKMDVELVVDSMEMADRINHLVLFSGDGEFRSMVAAVQRKGVRVTVISSITTRPPMVADDLRRQADCFIDLAQLSVDMGREPRQVEPREAPRPQERDIVAAPAPGRILAADPISAPVAANSVAPALHLNGNSAEISPGRLPQETQQRKPVLPKYRNPTTGDAWSGRGPYPPEWVKTIMRERGWSIEEFKLSEEFRAVLEAPAPV